MVAVVDGAVAGWAAVERGFQTLVYAGRRGGEASISMLRAW
jgi:hypothetical protein